MYVHTHLAYFRSDRVSFGICNTPHIVLTSHPHTHTTSQVRDLAPFALSLGFVVEEHAAGRGKLPPIKRRKKRVVYVATIEKASGLVNSLAELDRLHDLGLVVVDEVCVCVCVCVCE